MKGKELGTGISQLKDGRYIGRYTNRFGRRMPPIYSWNLKEVKDRLLKAKYEDSLGRDNVVHKNVTVQEMYRQWIKDKKGDIRPKTLHEYELAYNEHISPYGLCMVSDITITTVKSFISGMSDKGLAVGTIKTRKVVFSEIMDYAVEKHACLNNPFKGYKLPKVLRDKEKKNKQRRKDTKFMTEQQRKIFIDYIDNEKCCHLRSFYKFLMYTGLRIGEGMAIKWEQIDLDNRVMYIQDNCVEYYDNGMLHREYDAMTKTETSTRKIPINDMAYSILMEEKSRAVNKPFGLVFLNKNQKPLTYGNVSNSLTRLTKRINGTLPQQDRLPNITPHYFRHTFATMCLEKGINMKAVQHYMGHATLAMTADLYSHVTEDLAFEEMKKLNQVV